MIIDYQPYTAIYNVDNHNQRKRLPVLRAGKLGLKLYKVPLPLFPDIRDTLNQRIPVPIVAISPSNNYQ